MLIPEQQPMTVTADLNPNTAKQGKLRPLTSLPPPMLPTEQQLKGTAHQLPAGAHRSKGITTPQPSLLSSWLTHGSNSNTNNSGNDGGTSSNNGSSVSYSNSPRGTAAGDYQSHRGSYHVANEPYPQREYRQVVGSERRDRAESMEIDEQDHRQYQHQHQHQRNHQQYHQHHQLQNQHHQLQLQHHQHQDQYQQRQFQAAAPQRSQFWYEQRGRLEGNQLYMAAGASPIDATTAASPSSQSVIDLTADPTTPEKRKRGRRPKPKLEVQVEDDDGSGTKLGKEKKIKEAKPPKEKKIKEPKLPKEPKQKKVKGALGDGSMGAGGAGSKPERSILSFFDRSASALSSTKQTAASPQEDCHDDNQSSSASPTKGGFKQSCLSFDVLDPSKAESYISGMAAASKDDDRRVGSFMKELPKLTGRAPFEDLMTGMLMRSSKLPGLNKLNLHHLELNMDMLADVKMVHEFLNTFGTPLGLTNDSGEWITFDLLLSMIRNPRIDDRLLDLNCKMIMAAYEDGQTPKINRFNFPYFLAVGPETISSLEEQKEAKKNKHSAASGKKTAQLDRLGTIEYSVYTIADRIEALVKALHDITSSDRFHRFMRDEVEENITTLKRQKRKRAEVRKELETQTHDLETEMKAIEREAAELEVKRQTILASERENGPAEDDAGTARITAASRLQRLAQAKDARSKANELLSQQKSLANDLKAKESAWESKKEELEDIYLDDSEVQKDHNVPLTQLRGGQVVNTDDKLRVICLGSDRWGRKYWLWKEFGGVIIEDRAQVGPSTDTLALGPKDDTGTKQNDARQDVDTFTENEPVAIKDENVVSPADDLVNDVTQRMRTMAEPELAGNKFRAIRDDRMSIISLLSDQSPTEEKSLTLPRQQPEPVEVAPEKDLLDYGPIQTWSLISTAKELASITRALNGKGTRERILKASLQTMRKEIEASFDRIKTWAGCEYAGKNDQVVSVMGAVGQPLSEVDLMLLKKKRGRKSRQELADIAATQRELAVAEVDKSMDMDRANSEDPPSANLATDMEEDGSDHEQLPNTEDGDEAMQDDKYDIAEGFLAAIRDSGSGPLPFEYFKSIVQAAEEKLKELSLSICGGDSDAISTAIQKLQEDDEGRMDDRLLATVKVLDHCLKAMDESLQDTEDQETQDDSKAHESSKNGGAAGVKEQQGDLVMDSTDTRSPKVAANKQSLSIPVSVDPRLLTWLKTCRIDSMLKTVKTFGALHAWLDECIVAVESVVYEADDGAGEDEEMDGVGKKKQEGDEADEDENEEHEDEDEDEDENENEEDEGEDAHDEKAQDDDQEDDGEENEEDEHHGRQRKTRQESRLRVTTIRGRALRARSNRPVSYKYDFAEADEGEEADDEDADAVEGEGEDEDEDEGIATRLRRSKRTRH